MRKSENKISFEMGEIVAHLDKKIDDVGLSMNLKMDEMKNSVEVQNSKVQNDIKDLNLRMVEEQVKTNSRLDTMNANMSTMLNQIQSHEKRITELEKHDVAETAVQEHTFKTSGKDALVQCVPLLVKSLTIALVVIGSLAGCSGIIAKIFGK